jgi:pimeloyl-ACP methyl ester carboxylesterase
MKRENEAETLHQNSARPMAMLAARRPQRLTDQSALVHELAEHIGAPLALVGHSLGGSIALCAAAELGERLAGLILLEPNPFWLLQAANQAEFAEAWALRPLPRSSRFCRSAGPTGDSSGWSRAGIWRRCRTRSW